MSTDEAAFNLAICQDPADDTARLVYADWLDDRGLRPWHAELIRMQVGGCSRLDLFKAGRRWVRGPVAEEMREAFAPHVLFRWATSLPDFRLMWNRPEVTKRVTGTAVVERGFVAGIVCDLGFFMQNAEAVFMRHPVQWVWLADRVPSTTYDADTGTDRYHWWSERHGDLSSDPMLIPDRLARFLDWPRRAQQTEGPFHARTSEPGRAFAALSRACVTLGRIRAGLLHWRQMPRNP